MPFRITNIRKNRKRPGLQPQHLTGVNAAAAICRARVTGNRLDSTELVFEPGDITAGEYDFNVADQKGSAGAVTLVIQTILPMLLFAPGRQTPDVEPQMHANERESERMEPQVNASERESEGRESSMNLFRTRSMHGQDALATVSQVMIRGGTHVPFSPCYDYFAEVLLPFLRRLGFKLRTEIVRCGFFPVGNGEVKLEIEPENRPSRQELRLNGRGALRRASLVSAVANLPLAIAQRQASRFSWLYRSGGLEAATRQVPAQSPGTYVFFKAEYENLTVGFSSLGARGKPAEKVAEEAFEQFDRYRQTDAAVDEHLADQILIFLVLLGRPFSFTTNRITSHLLTNLWVLQQFGLNALIEGAEGCCGRVGSAGCGTANARE